MNNYKAQSTVALKKKVIKKALVVSLALEILMDII